MKCVVEGCKHEAKVREHCRQHYNRKLRTGELKRVMPRAGSPAPPGSHDKIYGAPLRALRLLRNDPPLPSLRDRRHLEAIEAMMPTTPWFYKE